MGGREALEEATSRLIAALEGFEDAVASRLKGGESITGLQTQVKALTAERDRLFAGLEAERQRSERLESASDEVSERLGGVIESVRSLMQTN